MEPFDRVSTHALTKVYGVTRALAGVDLELRSGEVTVIEGPNGSGKSTLVALLSQLARPTRGEIRYGALDGAAARRDVRRHLGVLAHAAMLYADLSAAENLRLFARLHGVGDPPARIAALVGRFALEPFLDRPIRTLSRGQLQRVALARALLHAPRLLLLDEPSTGLDARATDGLVEVVEAERARGAIVAVVTHDAAFADRVATRRVRLSRGRVVTGDEAGAEQGREAAS